MVVHRAKVHCFRIFFRHAEPFALSGAHRHIVTSELDMMVAQTYMPKETGMRNTVPDIPHAPPPVTPGAMDDSALLHRIGNHDTAAYDELFRRYYSRLCQFAVKMLDQNDLAEEVVDDAMMVVWRKAGAFRGDSQVSTWLFGIAYRLCRRALSDRYRRERNHLRQSDDDALSRFADDDPAANPEHVSEVNGFKRSLDAALARLSVEHQSTVQFVVLGRTYGEIARIMDCPENTVKTRMFHARSQLRKFLQQQDGHPSQDRGANHEQ